MAAVSGYKAVWSGSKCHINVEIDLAYEINDAVISEAKKAVASAMVEELAKSPEFQEGIRKLAVKRILKYLEMED